MKKHYFSGIHPEDFEKYGNNLGNEGNESSAIFTKDHAKDVGKKYITAHGVTNDMCFFDIQKIQGICVFHMMCI